MTIKELIEALSKLDESLPVFWQDHEYGEFIPVTGIEHVTLDKVYNTLEKEFVLI